MHVSEFLAFVSLSLHVAFLTFNIGIVLIALRLGLRRFTSSESNDIDGQKERKKYATNEKQDVNSIENSMDHTQ